MGPRSQRHAARPLHFFGLPGSPFPFFPYPSKRGNGAPGGAGPSDVGPGGPTGPPRAWQGARPPVTQGGGASRRSTRNDANGAMVSPRAVRPSLRLRPAKKRKQILFLLCSAAEMLSTHGQTQTRLRPRRRPSLIGASRPCPDPAFRLGNDREDGEPTAQSAQPAHAMNCVPEGIIGNRKFPAWPARRSRRAGTSRATIASIRSAKERRIWEGATP